jgi:nicotinate-nucleotide pyrophosphorylase (carboxylating)
MQELNKFLTSQQVRRMVQQALTEDIGPGDVTSQACIPADAMTEARIMAKAEGVIAGMAFVQEVFSQLDPAVIFWDLLQDGAEVKSGDTVCRISGRARAVLTGERTALNFLGHLSGIASAAARLAALVKGTHLTILDTRKTTPLLRQPEKYAVQVGGCHNHRTGLYDMVLIKENHIRAAGGIASAVARARAAAPRLKIEVETTNEDEVRQALEAGADRIMLDNMDDEMVRAMLAIIGGRAETEASGNMTAERITSLAESGLDFISLGSLTHSASVLDFSMLFKQTEP